MYGTFYIHRYEQYAQAYCALYWIFSYTALCIELVKASLPSTEELLSNSAREAERPPKAAAAPLRWAAAGPAVGGERRQTGCPPCVHPSIRPTWYSIKDQPKAVAPSARHCRAPHYRSIYYGGGGDTAALAKLCCAEPSEAMKIWGNAGQALVHFLPKRNRF